MKLWYKGYDLSRLVERYEGGRNVTLDALLARFDIWGSLGHVAQLSEVGLLTEEEANDLHWALCQLLLEADAGALLPATEQEDIHTLIEGTLTSRLGKTGKKLHTGRSRNDQVLTDLRLYAKESLLQVAGVLLATADTLLELACRYEWTPLPGYTHMQRGMLSSVGLWASAYAEALLDDCVALSSAYSLNDQSPLGSGAAYGSSLPLDRALSARVLGFSRLQHNVLAAANSRGKFEAAVVQALGLVMLDLSKFAQDALLYTTSEFGFFQVPQELCSGSSMMPQKRNCGALELVRARAQTVIAAGGQMMSLLAGLPSGYNMDYQETKAPFIESLHLTEESLAIVELFARNISVNSERARAACSDDLFATDRADALVREGVPFREAYRRAASPDQGESVASPPAEILAARLHERTGLGMPGNLGLKELQSLITGERAVWEERRQTFTEALLSLLRSRPHPEAAATPIPEYLLSPGTGEQFHTRPGEIVTGI